MLKKMTKNLLLICLSIMLSVSCGIVVFAADKEEALVTEVVLFSDFENEISKPWTGGAGWSTHSFTPQAKNGKAALKAELMPNESTNRAQTKMIAGDKPGMFLEGAWHDFSFYSKGSVPTKPVSLLVQVCLTNGTDRSIFIVSDSVLTTDYTFYKAGIKASIIAGKLNIDFKRPESENIINDIYLDAPAGTAIDYVNIIFMSESPEFYLDDINITRQVPEKIEYVTQDTIFSDFENEISKPWYGNGSTHSFTTEAKNGAAALLSTMNAGNDQNRIQVAGITEGSQVGQITKGVWHDLSFWGKVDVATTVTFNFIVYTSDGKDQSINLVSGSDITTAYTFYECGISVIEKGTTLEIQWKRPDTGIIKDSFLTFAEGTTITEFGMFIYTNSQKLIVDDIKISRQVPKPKTEIVSKTVFADGFESGSTGNWIGGLGNVNSTHSITNSAKNGSYAILSTLKGGQSQNRIQTNINTGVNSMNSGIWYDMEFWAKADVAGTINFIISLNSSNNKDGSDIFMVSDEAVTTEYKKFTFGIMYNNVQGKLVVSWQRNDMSSPTQGTFYSFAAGEYVSNVNLIGFTGTNQFYMDDFKISTKVELPIKIAKVIKAIDTIGTVTVDSKASIDSAKLYYGELTSEERSQVFNFNTLKAANRSYLLLNGVAPGTFDNNNVVFTFGAISDLHNSNVDKALSVLKDWSPNGMDALIMAGDLTDQVAYSNSTAEIPLIKASYDKGIAQDVEVFFSLGNHDSSNGSHAQDFYDGLGERYYRNDLDKEFTRTTGNRHSVIKGYHFIAIETDYETETIPQANLTYLDNTLKAITTDPAYKGEYIFIVSHVSPKNTVFASSPINDMDAIVKNYPQALLLTGHSHAPIGDERSIMQTNYTTVNLGSVSFMDSLNGYIETATSPNLVPNAYALSQGSMIEVDNRGNVKITRIDFTNNKQIKTPWILSAPQEDESHLCAYPIERKTKFAVAPVLGADAKISATYLDKSQIQITFDTATDDDMVFAYGIEFYDEGATTPSITYKSLSQFYDYSDISLMPKTKTITISGLVKLPHMVKVYAIDSYDKTSEKMECLGVKSPVTEVVSKDVVIINPNTESYILDDRYELSDKEDFSHVLPNVDKISDYKGGNLYVRVKGTAGNTAGPTTQFKLDTFNVTLDASDKYDIALVKEGKLNYISGANLKFTLTVKDSYKDYNLLVKANGVILNKSTNNEYSVIMDADVSITVELTPFTYVVTLPTVDGITVTGVTGSTTVNKGDSYKFKVALDADYNKSTIVVKVNGTIIEAVNGEYTISTIDKNVTITIEGVVKNPVITPQTPKTGCKSEMSSSACSVAILVILAAAMLLVIKRKQVIK